MATMYYLFFGFLFTAVCSDNGDGSGVLSASMPTHGIFILLDQNEAKNQGLAARLNCPLISGNKTTEGWKPSSAKLNSLRSDKSDCVSEIIDNSLRLEQPRPNERESASSSLQLLNLPPENFLTRIDVNNIFISTGLTNSMNVAFDIFKNLKEEALSFVLKISSDEAWTLGRYQVSPPSANEDKRNLIIAIASAELGVREATGNNDGPRVEEYLRYTNLGKGYEWCAAFVSWVYGQAGFDVPRNPWSPALFPEYRVYWRSGEKVKRLESVKVKADVFGIYGTKVKRINHVGLVKEMSNDYLITIEGNSNDRVESRRRHLRTIYAFVDWIN